MMNIPSTFKKALIGAAVAAVVSAPAFADVLTFTEVKPLVKAPQGAVFQLSQFDPALGTLKQVDLTWETSVAFNAQIFQNGAGSADLFDAGIQFDFNAPQVTIAQRNIPTVLFSWFDNTPSPIVYAPTNSAKKGNGQQVAQVNWAPYIGTGDFNVTWQTSEVSDGAGPVWVGKDGFQAGVLDDRLGGYNFSVTYNYDPASVPEPGSLALLALGGMAVGFARRQRKS